MRLLLVVLCFIATIVRAATNPPAAPFSAKERAQGYSDRVILAKPRATERATVGAAESRERVRVRESFARFGDLRVITLEPGDTVEAAVARLQATGRYEFVEPDHLMYQDATPNDPSFGSQWALNNTGQQISGSTAGADIQALAAWDIIHDAPGVIVAQIDGGVRLDHLDIAPNLWVNPSPTFGDVNGATIIFGARSGNPSDEGGHGTHVAGIICAAGNNGVATSGVAWRVQLMPLKNSGADGASSASDSAACVDYAVAHGAQIINCSFGGTTFSQTFFTALRAARDAGVIVVCSAGNSGLSNDLSPHYPSNYLLDNLVAVGNSTPADTASASSDYGALVDLFAPGTSILSLNYASTTGTVTFSGTSMAAPMVTGAMALLKAQFPNDTYRQLINRLLRGADLKAALASRAQTSARLNLFRSLTTTNNRPFNDDFATRAVITGSTLTLRSNNRGATTESGEPVHANVSSAGSTLWWQWIPSTSGNATVDTIGSDYDTVLAVYTGTALNNLVAVASNDDSGGATTSRLSFSATALTSYYIAVAGKAGAAGYTQLNLASGPANDNFADATALVGESLHVSGRNVSGTLEPGEPRILGAAGGASVWYKWTAPRSARFQVSAFSTSFDTLLAVYTGTALGNLAVVDASDNTDVSPGVTNADSRCTIDAVAGTTYYFQVDSNTAVRGDFTISLTDSIWQRSTKGAISGAPAVGADGTIYFAGGTPDKNLYAIARDGSFKWSFALGAATDDCSPAIGSDGTIYFGAFDGVFTALTPDGVVRWQRKVATSVGVSPAIAADGTLYTRGTDGYLYALDPADGTTKWRYHFNTVSTSVYASPSIASDGTIYLMATDTNLNAIRPDGTLKWQYAFDSFGYCVPAVDAAGNIYVTTYTPGKLWSLTPAGELRWVYAAGTGSSSSSSPTLSADGATVYFADNARNFHAVNTATGARRWQLLLGDSVLSSTTAIDSNGVLYIGCYDDKLYAINPTGTVKRTWDTAGFIRSSPAIFGTTLYVGSLDAKLYAFDLGGATAAGGPWPQYRHNARRLGRAATEALAVTVAPQSRAALVGDTIVLSVVATGQGPLAFQWFKDGVAITGATSASYSITSATTANAGSYTVKVTGPQGAVTSAAAAVIVNPVVLSTAGRLINLSILAPLAAGETITMGTVLGGTGTVGTKPLLARAAGPSLTQFGIAASLPNPTMTLNNTTSSRAVVVATNTGWGGGASLTNAFAAVGAFPYIAAASKDSALFQPGLAPGNYTVQVADATGGAGTVIAELYDSTSANAFAVTTPRLINVSVLKQIAAGSSLTTGFVIGGTTSVKVLVRVVGPTLGQAPFGISGVMASPKLELFNNATNTKLNENTAWGGSTTLTSAFTSVGAFQLANANTKDCVLLATLAPGQYSARASSADGSGGLTLVEVYEVP